MLGLLLAPWVVAASPYDGLIVAAAQHYSLEPALVKAVIKCESNFDPRAVSPRGAQGLMQLMPATQVTLGVTDVFEPQHNIAAGVRYLAMLQQTFGSRVPLLLAAYNAGPQAIIDAGYEVPDWGETQGYVSCVLAARQRYREHGVNSLPAHVAFISEPATVSTALRVVPLRISPRVAQVGQRVVLHLEALNTTSQVAHGVVNLTYAESSLSSLALRTAVGETTVQLTAQPETQASQHGRVYQFMQGDWAVWQPGQRRMAAWVLVPRLGHDVALHLSVLLYDSTLSRVQDRWSTVVRLPVLER
jgi:SLT domain-containing protein